MTFKVSDLRKPGRLYCTVGMENTDVIYEITDVFTLLRVIFRKIDFLKLIAEIMEVSVNKLWMVSNMFENKRGWCGGDQKLTEILSDYMSVYRVNH